MGNKQLDLTGKTFGKLTVIKMNGRSKGGISKWLCKCECGNTVTVVCTNLNNGHTKNILQKCLTRY